MKFDENFFNNLMKVIDSKSMLFTMKDIRENVIDIDSERVNFHLQMAFDRGFVTLIESEYNKVAFVDRHANSKGRLTWEGVKYIMSLPKGQY